MREINHLYDICTKLESSEPCYISIRRRAKGARRDVAQANRGDPRLRAEIISRRIRLRAFSAVCRVLVVTSSEQSGDDDSTFAVVVTALQ